MIKAKYDKEADAIYIYLSNKAYAYGKDLDEVRRIDYASDNTPIGIELLDVSKGININDLPDRKGISAYLSKHNICIYS